MRVIAGRYKGARLKAPKGRGVRPTSDRVKESLFAILRDDVDGRRTLDLFAGAGSLGIEALSRGAESCVFVDSNAKSCRIIRDNLIAARVPKSATRVMTTDASDAVRQLHAANESFRLAFLDPPYDSSLAHEALQTLGILAPVVSPSGLVIVEHATQATLSDFYGVLTRVRVQKYGDTTLSFYAQTTKGDETE